MKYLQIHKLIVLIFICIFTLFEAFFIYTYAIGYFTWNLKWPIDVWSQFNVAEQDVDNHWGRYTYKDKNIIETIKRRYNQIFN